MIDKRKQIDKTLANILSELRINKELTQSLLATELGLTQAIIGYYEKGVRLPSVNVLEKYSDYFGYDMNRLYEARITTVKNTLELLGDDAPPYIKDEYKIIKYFENKA